MSIPRHAGKGERVESGNVLLLAARTVVQASPRSDRTGFANQTSLAGMSKKRGAWISAVVPGAGKARMDAARELLEKLAVGVYSCMGYRADSFIVTPRLVDVFRQVCGLAGVEYRDGALAYARTLHTLLATGPSLDGAERSLRASNATMPLQQQSISSIKPSARVVEGVDFVRLHVDILKHAGAECADLVEDFRGAMLLHTSHAAVVAPFVARMTEEAMSCRIRIETMEPGAAGAQAGVAAPVRRRKMSL